MPTWKLDLSKKYHYPRLQLFAFLLAFVAFGRARGAGWAADEVDIFLSLTTLAFAVALIVSIRSKFFLIATTFSFFCYQFAILPNASYSNAQLIITTLSFTMCLSYVILAWRNRNLDVDFAEWYRCFAPVGRWLLIIMYIYGTFHKINTDFLDPYYSCATQVWISSPLPDWLLHATWAHYGAIYGTLILEGTALIFLIFRRTRYWGLLLGVPFHYFIGMNWYYTYVNYSAISILLHFLFLPENSLNQFRASKIGRWLANNPEITLVLKLLLLLSFVVHDRASGSGWFDIRYAWNIFGFMMLCFIVVYGRGRNQRKGRLSDERRYYLWSPIIGLNLISLWFFFNGLTPYIGLKNTQAITMYSNLIMEEGRTNHLLFDKPPYLFDTLNDTVEIHDTNSRNLQWIIDRERKMVYYGLLDFLDRHPEKDFIWVTFTRNGKLYQQATFYDMPDNDMLHWSWFRKWYVFESFSPAERRRCRQ